MADDSPPPPIPSSPRSLPTNGESFASTPKLDPIIEHVQSRHGEIAKSASSTNISFKGEAPPGAARSRSSSFGRPGVGPRKNSGGRRRSPPPARRFSERITFDNFTNLEASSNNTVSYTLNAKHKGYHLMRHSRTFLVGLDEHDYSEIALKWVLEDLVDDGDEIICLRVVHKDPDAVPNYQDEARKTMESIQKLNDGNLAISLILEFALGKVHTTFQRMITIYEPAMLIVGTKGKGSGGFQSLVTNRNSFSKWCLQYSPIPVVVVRPTEKRIKKKLKRDTDPTRQDYIKLLRASGVDNHETTHAGSLYHAVETSQDPHSEAVAVAVALGLPKHFEQYPHDDSDSLRQLRKVDSARSESTNGASSRPITPNPTVQSPEVIEAVMSPRSDDLDTPGASADEESDADDEEGEFEAVPGHILLERQRMHDMEVGEGVPLKKHSISSIDSAGSGSMADAEEESVRDGEVDGHERPQVEEEEKPSPM